MPQIDDYWLWAGNGFKGLVGILTKLCEDSRPSPETLAKLEKFHKELGEIIEACRIKEGQ